MAGQEKLSYLPALDTIRTMLKAGAILALIFGIILILLGIIYIAVIASVALFLAPIIFGGALISIIFGVVDFVVYIKVKEIIGLVESQRYREAKEKTFIWSIVALILGGILPGIFLLIAYIKYDEVIRATQSSAK